MAINLCTWQLERHWSAIKILMNMKQNQEFSFILSYLLELTFWEYVTESMLQLEPIKETLKMYDWTFIEKDW